VKLCCVVAKPSGSGTIGGSISGQATLQIDFAGHTLSGFTSNTMATPSGGVAAAWNNMNLSGTLAGNVLTGTTSTNALATPATALALSASATGTFNGNLYGPAGQDAALVWHLYDGSGGAIGTIGVAQTGGSSSSGSVSATTGGSGASGGITVTPSDRRLKRDIEPLEVLANGLRLYRFRYLTDDRAFVGVMAQDLLQDPRFASAVIRSPSGFFLVDYTRLGFAPQDEAGMRQAGAAAIAAVLAVA